MDPVALNNAAARALSVGRPHAARDLADLVERDRQRPCAGRSRGRAQSAPDRRCSRGRHARMKRALGTDIGTIHFVGIGGIGMSGIAEVMHQLGYKVQGSDVAECYVVERLRKKGIPVSDRPCARQSRRRGGRRLSRPRSRTAIPRSQAAAERRLPRRAPRRDARRADAHAEDRRGRRHARQDHDDVDGRGAARRRRDRPDRDQRRHHQSLRLERAARQERLVVVEADESDGSFLRLDGTIAVVTNIDPEHLEHYGSFDRVKDAFVEFVENVPFYGAGGAVRRSSRGPEHHRRASATAGSSPTVSLRSPTFAATMSTAGAGRQRIRRVDPATRDGERRTIAVSTCPCPAGTMSRTRSRRSPSRSSSEFRTRQSVAGFATFRRGQAPLHQGRRGRRRDHHRRLCPPSDRNPRRAGGGARRRRRAGDRGVQPHRYTRLQIADG